MRKSLCIVALGGWDDWAAGENTVRLLPHGETETWSIRDVSGILLQPVASQESPALCGREKELECSLGPFSPTFQNLNESRGSKGKHFPTTSIATLHPCWLRTPDSNPHYRPPHLFSALSTSVKWMLWCFLRRLAVKMNWDTCPVQNPMLCWIGEDPWKRHGNLLQYSQPGESTERNLVGYSFTRLHRIKPLTRRFNTHIYTAYLTVAKQILKIFIIKNKVWDCVMMDSN